MKILGSFAALAFCLMAPAAAETTIAVDFDRVTKAGGNQRAAGVNLCWLLDSDLRRKQPVPMSKVLAELQVGILRFPFGHLADNYLWHTPPYDDTKDGLRPKVASVKMQPGSMTWAVKPDGTMPEAMDFDEYLSLCGKIGAKPLVCVNVLSFKYPGGPTYEELKASAVAWVKYAKKQRLPVAYWQLGNEVEHSKDGRLLPPEYAELYEDFARAMKEADPSAQIGPGILNSTAHYQAIAGKCPELVDFVGVHQYMWHLDKLCPDYAGWRDCRDTFIGNIERAADVLSKAGLPQVKLLVTETSEMGSPAMGLVNNTYKALWGFEVLMNELFHPRVAYSFYWVTHTPWNFGGYAAEPARDGSVLLRMRTNARTPTGEILKLINENLLTEVVSATRVSGRLRAYAMRSKDGHHRVLFLLNRDDHAAGVVIPLDRAANQRITCCREFSGKSPDDVSPVVRDRELPQVEDGTLRASLPPLSITVVRLDG